MRRSMEAMGEVSLEVGDLTVRVLSSAETAPSGTAASAPLRVSFMFGLRTAKVWLE